MKKLEGAEFFKGLVKISDESEVKEVFQKEGIEISDEDLKDISKFISITLESISKISDKELDSIASGVSDDLVKKISDPLSDWSFKKSTEHKIGSVPGTFYYRMNEHSDKIVEGFLAVLFVVGTIGVQKIIQKGREKVGGQTITGLKIIRI